MFADDDRSKIASHSGIIVDLLHLVRILRAEYAAQSELLGLTLELNRGLQEKLARGSDRYLSLLAQHRALMSGRTNAEERQALDEDLSIAGQAPIVELERAA